MSIISLCDSQDQFCNEMEEFVGITDVLNRLIDILPEDSQSVPSELEVIIGEEGFNPIEAIKNAFKALIQFIGRVISRIGEMISNLFSREESVKRKQEALDRKKEEAKKNKDSPLIQHLNQREEELYRTHKFKRIPKKSAVASYARGSIDALNALTKNGQVMREFEKLTNDLLSKDVLEGRKEVPQLDLRKIFPHELANHLPKIGYKLELSEHKIKFDSVPDFSLAIENATAADAGWTKSMETREFEDLDVPKKSGHVLKDEFGKAARDIKDRLVRFTTSDQMQSKRGTEVAKQISYIVSAISAMQIFCGSIGSLLVFSKLEYTHCSHEYWAKCMMISDKAAS